MAKKYYVVWSGRETGVFDDWTVCRTHIDGYKGAKYKGFKTLAEAEEAFRSNKTIASPKAKSSSKKSASGKPRTLTADEIAALPVDIKIFTDGGCEPNPGEAGSGVAVYRNDKVSELWFGLYNPEGTNNTAELSAFKQALTMAAAEIRDGRSVAIFCDSSYAIQCVTQWAINWEKNGWTKKGGEIKNLELIKEMFALHQSLAGAVQVFHVKGHAGVEGNELADRMSILAMETKTTEFCLYRDDLDIPGILALRAG